ncbi:MAG: acetylglutamate kinase [Candidatus Eremiobacteraeota bacterium]|nr:acetylglutamate kinase [Candidatus Eremiobacteraeota bacterium]
MLIVLKYGGNAMAAPSAEDPLLDDVAERVAGGDRVVLVHGGGPQIDAALEERGIVTHRVAGLRVTDAATLAVTESVLCGTVNKAIVRALLVRGALAAGLSGQDGALLEARPLAIDGRSLGYVGEIVRVIPRVLHALLDAGFVPVIAPLGITRDGATALNVNADTAAGAIAGALGADAYVVVTNVPRVRRLVDDPATEIARLTIAEAHAYLADGTFDGGMRPKMESALDALAAGAASAVICGGGRGALSRALDGHGTTIVAS